MMKKLLAVALLASTPLMALPALAADIDAQPTEVTTPYDWSGPYFGLQIGGVVNGGTDVTILGVPITTDNSTSGVIGGVLGGYNFQRDNWVFGLDTDFSISSVDSQFAGADFDLDTLSTARLRAGYAFDRVLPYVTGGLAYSFTQLSVPAVPFDDRDFTIGWTAGAGVEYAATDRIHVRLQYNYIDLQDADFNVAGVPLALDADDLHVVRAGVSIKTGFILDKILGR